MSGMTIPIPLAARSGEVRWVQRTSGAGHPYLTLESALPRIPDFWLDSIVYMYKDAEAASDAATLQSGATGFLVSVPALRRDRVFAYLVTNAHVADAAPCMRVNLRAGGYDTLSLPADAWWHHPDGDDVAVAPITLPAERYATRTIDYAFLLTEDAVTELGFGPGDDCFFMGRHVSLDGKKTNTPSVRFGAVSMMNAEPIYQEGRGHYQQSIVVEARSLGGYSGAPVFVYQSQVIHKDPAPLDSDDVGVVAGTLVKSPVRVLGIDWGHMTNANAKTASGFSSLDKPDRDLALNSGMMLVVPAWKIREAIDRPELAAMRDKVNEMAKEESEVESTGAVMDAFETDDPDAPLALAPVDPGDELG